MTTQNDKVIEEIRKLCDYLKKKHQTLAKRTHVRPLDEFEEGKYSTLELIIMELDIILPPLKQSVSTDADANN